MKKNNKGEPIDYIIGFKNFLGCKIDLSLRPFIPRPETEYWVGEVIKKLKIENLLKIENCKLKIKVLDIFSGSGCVGIGVLKHIPWATGCFVEKNKKFLKQIKINLELNKISRRRYKIIQSDIFQNVKEKYDYILSNPPYVAKKRKNEIQKSVLEFEPKMALFGGNDGLFYINKFLKEAQKHLKKDGKIYMEFDWGQKKKIEKIVKKYNYKNYEFQKDHFNRWRYLTVN